MVHQCVINSVALWLHICVVSLLMCVAPFGSRLTNRNWLFNEV